MGTVQAPFDPDAPFDEEYYEEATNKLAQYAGVVDAKGRPDVLGQGTFATVYRAVNKDGPRQEYAIKVMTKPWKDISKLEKKLIKSEIDTLFKCKHQHVIGLYYRSYYACVLSLFQHF